MMHSFRSNADHTRLISKSIFITNFPDSTTSKDLWNLCQPYGTVVDVFIPNRKSKSGKRFAFIRFIKVDNIDRLVGNLCTLWIGRFHLHANVVRFDRPPKYASRSSHPVNPKPANHVSPVATSFVSAVKGGLWVMIELESAKTKLNLMNHVGVASWFRSLCNAQSDFVAKERIVWVDIEGVPLHAWSRSTFFKIGSGKKIGGWVIWHEENILESFKIIVKGKVFCVRAKELFVWNPTFKDIPEAVHCSDDESIKGEAEMNGEDRYENEQGQSFNAKEVSKDPFNIYDLLNKTKKVVGTSGSDTSLPYPPGFTPDKSTNVINEKEVSDAAKVRSNSKSDGGNSRILEEVENIDGCFSSEGRNIGVKPKEGGSILEILDEMIKVGQTMGFSACRVVVWCTKSIWSKYYWNLKELRLIGTSGGMNSGVYAPLSLSSKKCYGVTFSSLLERWGSTFNAHGANVFNTFISSSGLIDVQLEGYAFTWAHPSASKMSKLDRFLVSDGLISSFPHISAICLDRHLSDHRPILLRECIYDFGAIPFRFYHSWFGLPGFVQMIKVEFPLMSFYYPFGSMKLLHDSSILRSFVDNIQKAKIRWAIEGDENSKFFHAIINKKRANLSVKEEFHNHFATRFQDPGANRGNINFTFPNRLSLDQVSDLESPISRDEIRLAVWGCGEDKSPGPDGFTFEFFRKFWKVVGPDFCIAVEWFFEHGSFAIGCNSSFVALIPKILDPKIVSDYRPISLIGSLYKVITKILATRLSSVISSLISDVQSAFLPNRQILDGPFILSELLSWCKFKYNQAMVFKVDFAKAYDSIRWDYLDDVLNSFGFGSKWRSWIRGSLISGKASILVNGSPTSEFQFHRGLKQGDPLAPFLFILIMESLHLSFSHVVEAGIFTGIEIGLSINVKKSQLLGIGISDSIVSEAAKSLGCSIMKTPFKYLGIPVGGNMSLIKAWDESIVKHKRRLSKWKLKTLS
ncbi:RNA-directed DNA polymerase, eukaryota, partial [Tanacetum coccineum]